MSYPKIKRIKKGEIFVGPIASSNGPCELWGTVVAEDDGILIVFNASNGVVLYKPELEKAGLKFKRYAKKSKL